MYKAWLIFHNKVNCYFDVLLPFQLVLLFSSQASSLQEVRFRGWNNILILLMFQPLRFFICSHLYFYRKLIGAVITACWKQVGQSYVFHSRGAVGTGKTEIHLDSFSFCVPVCVSQPFIRLLTTAHQNTFRGIKQNQLKHLCLKGPSLLICHTSLGKRFFQGIVQDCALAQSYANCQGKISWSTLMTIPNIDDWGSGEGRDPAGPPTRKEGRTGKECEGWGLP